MLNEADNRFEIAAQQKIKGITTDGIDESFPVHLPRSIYGATKLASEYMIQEYVSTYGIQAVINRCGVIAGPGQFGKVDQGVFTMWMANHFYQKPLKYIGFNGEGKQVRDLLHPWDLYQLILQQIDHMDKLNGDSFNVGGGVHCSTSLKELTQICQNLTGNEVSIDSINQTTSVDIPLYVSNNSRVANLLKWKPTFNPSLIMEQIYQWLKVNKVELKSLFL